MNESVYYSIDKLHTALAAQKAVTFKYFEYSVQKERVYRRGGKRYIVFPHGLVWNSENYYLVGWDGAKKEIRHYRVDKMDDLSVTCLKLSEGEHGQRADFDMAEYTAKHFGMFSGREGRVQLRCKNHMVGVVLDRFGQETSLIPDGEGYFTVTVDAVVSPQFWGWLFGLGTSVELTAPKWAMEEYRAQLRTVAERYRV